MCNNCNKPSPDCECLPVPIEPPYVPPTGNTVYLKEDCEPHTDKDEKVKVNQTDPNAGYLFDKIILGECLQKSVTSDFRLKIEIDFDCLCEKLQECIGDGGGNTCNPQPNQPSVTASSLSICGSQTSILMANNYNGTLNWYRNGQIIAGAADNEYIVLGQGGNYWARNTTVCGYAESAPVSITYTADCICSPAALIPILTTSSNTVQPNQTVLLSANNCNGTLAILNANNNTVIGNTVANVGVGSYYARCSNACGSAVSTAITITQAQTVTYTATRTGDFTRNNCGNNSCGEICTGTTVTYVKTYQSTTSQQAADQLASSDSNYNAEGQAYANANGICNCPPTPEITFSHTETNPTCVGSTIQTDGTITVFNLNNVTKIGYSPTNYAAITYSNAVAVTNNLFATNLASGTYYIKVFFSETCFEQFTVTLTAPNCGQPQFNFTQAACNVDGSYTTASVAITNATGYFKAEVSNNGVFTCSATCTISAGTCNLALAAPVTSPSIIYTVRLYTDNSCISYVERQFTVVRPECFTYTLSSSKNCVNNTSAITISNAPIGAVVKLCTNDSFTCANNCTVPDATVNGSGIAIISNIPLPAANQTQIYTVRVYKISTNCNYFVEKTISITNDCCRLNITNSQISC